MTQGLHSKHSFCRVLCVAALTALATPVFANSTSYSCAVTETCIYADFKSTDCVATTDASALDLRITQGADNFDTIAAITFEGATMDLALNGIGHGAPPPALKIGQDPSTVPDLDPNWSMGGLTFGTTVDRFLNLTMGYADGRPDSAILILPRDGVNMSYLASCTCVGETQC